MIWAVVIIQGARYEIIFEYSVKLIQVIAYELQLNVTSNLFHRNTKLAGPCVKAQKDIFVYTLLRNARV